MTEESTAPSIPIFNFSPYVANAGTVGTAPLFDNPQPGKNVTFNTQITDFQLPALPRPTVNFKPRSILKTKLPAGFPAGAAENPGGNWMDDFQWVVTHPYAHQDQLDELLSSNQFKRKLDHITYNDLSILTRYRNVPNLRIPIIEAFTSYVNRNARRSERKNSYEIGSLPPFDYHRSVAKHQRKKNRNINYEI